MFIHLIKNIFAHPLKLDNIVTSKVFYDVIAFGELKVETPYKELYVLEINTYTTVWLFKNLFILGQYS